jgi:FtsZ-binding cell division protein ZapB
MVHRYSVSLYDEEIYQDDDGTFVYYFDYADLEQRFDALSSKFAALVEEQTAIERERDELKEENETLRCHAHDAELAFERNAELEAENAMLRRRLEPDIYLAERGIV